MAKKFTANCDFGGQKSPVTLYVGDPSLGSHPLNFQSKWLSESRGGTVPQDIMDAFAKLAEISQKSKVSFEELCVYVIEELNAANSLASDAHQATELSSPKK